MLQSWDNMPRDTGDGEDIYRSPSLVLLEARAVDSCFHRRLAVNVDRVRGCIQVITMGRVMTQGTRKK
jgi:hypothetical protein